MVCELAMVCWEKATLAHRVVCWGVGAGVNVGSAVTVGAKVAVGASLMISQSFSYQAILSSVLPAASKSISESPSTSAATTSRTSPKSVVISCSVKDSEPSFSDHATCTASVSPRRASREQHFRAGGHGVVVVVRRSKINVPVPVQVLRDA